MSLKLAGCAAASVAASIAWIAAGPSLVRMFQVSATRSRQQLSSWNRRGIAASSRSDSAAAKASSQRCASFMGSGSPAGAAAPAAAAARGAAAAASRGAGAAAGRAGGGGDGAVHAGEGAAEAVEMALEARAGVVVLLHRGGDRGAAQQGGEALGPSLLHVERHGVGQEARELLRGRRRRAHAREVVDRKSVV